MIPDEAVEAAAKVPEPMRLLLDQSTAAYQNADRRAYERWAERLKG